MRALRYWPYQRLHRLLCEGTDMGSEEEDCGLARVIVGIDL